MILENVTMDYKQCLVCNTKMVPAFTINSFRFVECPKCKFLAILDSIDPTNLENIYSNEYYTLYPNRYTHATNQQRNLWLRRLQLINDFQQSKGLNRILDIGCGTGVFLEVAMSQGWDVYGIEISTKAVELAAEKVGSARVSKDLFSIDESQSSFDVICMWAMIEHVPNPVDYFKKAFALLRPGGIFALSTVNTNAWNRKMFNKKWRYFVPPEHLVYFNTNNIQAMLLQNNFETLLVSTWFNDAAFFQGLSYQVFEDHRLPIRILRKVITKPIKFFANAFDRGDNMEIIAKKADYESLPY